MNEIARIKEKIGKLIFGGILTGLGGVLFYIGACAVFTLFTTKATGVDAVILPIGGAVLLTFGLLFVGLGLVLFTDRGT